LQSSASWASDLREQLLETGASAAQGRLVLRLLSNVVRRAPETDGTLGALRQALRAQSLLSIEPVRRLIARELHPEFLASSGIMLRLGTVGLESGELRYVTETGSFVSRENQPLDLPTVPIAEAVIASSSIPLIFPPIVIGDEHYVDGGVREILPLHHPFTYLGAEQIFAIAAGAIGVQPAPSFEGRGMLDIARRVMTDIGPDETIRGELDPPRGWGRRVAIVVPEFDVHDALTVDSALIAISIDYGWMRAADVLLNLPRPVAQLSRDIAEARVRLRELNGPIESILAPSLPPADSDEAAAEREAVRDRLEASIAARRAAGGPLPPGHPRWERDTVFTD
jgi:NTE family protein